MSNFMGKRTEARYSWGNLIVFSVVCRKEGARQRNQPFRSAFTGMSDHLTVSRLLGRHILFRLLPGLAALGFILAGCGNPTTTQNQRSSTPVSLPAIPALGGLPAGIVNALPAGGLSPDTTLQLTIGLKTNRQALADDLAAMSDPSSPHYGQFLTPAEVAQRYGASQSTIDTVTHFFTSQGFKVVALSSLRDSLTVSGTILQIAAALHVVTQNFQQHGKTFFAPAGDVTLPPDIQQYITSILGMSDFGQPNPKPTPPPDLPPACKGESGTRPEAIANTYHYTDAYNAGYTGKGISIGVVEFNDDVSEKDVNTFLSCTTGGKLHRQLVRVNGGAVATDDGSTGEAELDFEYLAALAPDAQLVEYQYNFCASIICLPDTPSFPAAYEAVLSKIAQDGRVQVASASWGADEQFFSRSELFAIDQTIQRMAAEGITLAVASGDCAAFDDGTYGKPTIDFPSSDPYALAVGGTVLATDGTGTRASEPAWSSANPDKGQCDNSWGTGGGVSVVWRQPSWQKGAGVKNTYSTGFRQTPDVAAAADNLPLYFQGQWYNSGGTSAAAPIWAAGIALVDQGLLQHKKALVGGPATFYELANKGGSLQPFYDVTKGDNIYYKTGAGWDYPTGWGAPNILDFGNALGAF
jgi:kumamolisin